MFYFGSGVFNPKILAAPKEEKLIPCNLMINPTYSFQAINIESILAY